MSKRLYGKYICTNCFLDGNPVFNKHVCPACKSKAIIPTSTPRGHDLIVARYGVNAIQPQNIASSAQRKWAKINGVLIMLIFFSLIYLSPPKRDHQTDDTIETQKTKVATLSCSGGMKAKEEDFQENLYPDKITAKVVCMKYMENLLKAPSTAEFSWGTDGIDLSDDCMTFSVHDYVDAQNGFGAMIRTYYTCKTQRSNYDPREFTVADFSSFTK